MLLSQLYISSSLYHILNCCFKDIEDWVQWTAIFFF